MESVLCIFYRISYLNLYMHDCVTRREKTNMGGKTRILMHKVESDNNNYAMRFKC